ncbi:MAG: hypothetical protein M1588_02240 [Planctomycetes bacterium]|nr:hypothetical protein [Planctomycetota bacterium]
MKSKVVNLAMAAALAATLVLGVVGCSQWHGDNANAPQISVHTQHNTVQVGETVWVHAATMNLTNSSIHWKVTPTTATITPDHSRADQYAKFSASQPGGYVVKAFAKTGHDQWVTSRTSITVVSVGSR